MALAVRAAVALAVRAAVALAVRARAAVDLAARACYRGSMLRRLAPFACALAASALVASGCHSVPTASRSSSTSSRAADRRAAASLESSGRVASFRLSDIKHVFVIMLENESEASDFGQPSADPYLAKTLRSEGVLLENYYAVGHFSADNYIATISGQPPNGSTQSDCPIFAPFKTRRVLRGGIQAGDGCVYPADIPNLGTQLTAKGRTWKAYMQDMGNIPSRESAACGHPVLGHADGTQVAVKGDGYASRHDPFVYFESVIGRTSYCDAHVVALGSPTGKMPRSALPGETGLATDLESARTTPAFSFITPNLCLDGHDYPCRNQASHGSALADIDSFLSTWVPKILHSPAYMDGGMLVITFDEAVGDATACCNEKADPGASPHTRPGLTGPGGGKVGALVISPFAQPGTVDSHPYNHYSLLATIETIFGLERLADAATVPAIFGADVFSRR